MKPVPTKLGYSFIELIVIVGAIALVASFGLARYNDFVDRQTVYQGADTLVSNLRLVQAKALSGDKPVGCTTLTGYQVTFAQISYSTQALCDPEGLVANTLSVVSLPGHVNVAPEVNSFVYNAVGRGTTVDQTIQVVGRQITVPVVLSSGSITQLTATASVIVPTTPTPTPYSCPWPPGDPRCS